MKTIFLLIKLVAEYSIANDNWKPSYRHNIHERINHKANPDMVKCKLHILNTSPDFREKWTKEDKKNDYEFRCLELGLRPFHFTDEQWNHYLRDVADEEHFNKCEAKNAWMYQL